MITKLMHKCFQHLAFTLTPVKTPSRVYKYLVIPELQHDVIRRPDHCDSATHDVISRHERLSG